MFDGLFLTIAGIDYLISCFIYIFLNHHNDYNKQNSLLAAIIVFIVLGIIILAFYLKLKNKNINEKRLMLIDNISALILSFCLSFYVYYEGSYHNWINRNGQFWILVSILIFIFSIFIFSDISFFVIYALNPKKSNTLVLITEIISFLLCIFVFCCSRFLGRHETSFSVLMSIIVFLYGNICLLYFLNKEKKEFIKEITGSDSDDIIIKNDNKIFISHSGIDKEYSTALYDLLKKIGVPDSQIFYSSMAENGVPLGEDIYDYLFKQFKDYNLHVIFMLSENYYNSVYCLQEMGAAWVLKHKTDTVLLPAFTEDKIKGSINPNEINIKLDSEEYDLKVRLEQFKDEISEEFEIEKITSIKWERVRDEFIEKVKQISAA